MSTTELKQKALELIDHADEEELLAVIDILQQPLQRKYEYTEADMNQWNEISAKYESGETRGYTLEEATAFARDKYKQKHGL